MSIGLQRNNPNKTSKKVENEEVDDLNVLEDDGDGDTPSPKLNHSNKLVIAAVGIAIVVAIVGVLFTRGNKGADTGNVSDSSDAEVADSGTSGTSNTSDTMDDTNGKVDGDGADEETGADGSDSTTDSGNSIYDENGKTIDPNGINPGEHNYADSSNNQTSATVYSADDYIKDLNGLDVSAVYRAADISYVTDYISYEAHRAIVDQGMELYWLEAEYNGRKYRVQCPFYYFKTLGATGICKVEVEVVSTTNGGKIITYMQVVPDDFERDE